MAGSNERSMTPSFTPFRPRSAIPSSRVSLPLPPCLPQGTLTTLTENLFYESSCRSHLLRPRLHRPADRDGGGQFRSVAEDGLPSVLPLDPGGALPLGGGCRGLGLPGSERATGVSRRRSHHAPGTGGRQSHPCRSPLDHD